jgi:CheY-like chemotaxis protein
VLVGDVLEMLGIEMRPALNGAQALTVAAQEPPRAVILDLMMPVMNGYGFLDHLQEVCGGCGGVPIILLSALADANDHRLRELPGVVGVVSKGGYTVERLRDLIPPLLKK